jgi:hypothetical protein
MRIPQFFGKSADVGRLAKIAKIPDAWAAELNNG